MTTQLSSHGGSLAELSPPVRAKLLCLGESFHYAAGETIFEKGNAGFYLYVIQGGRVDLDISSVSDCRASLAVLEAGDIFGWSALSKSRIETVSARATAEVEVLRIKGELVRDLCRRDAEAGVEIYRVLAEAVSPCLIPGKEMTAFPPGEEPAVRLGRPAGAGNADPESTGRESRSDFSREAKLVLETLEQIIVRHPFFADMAPKHLCLITGCAKNVRFKQGEVLFREGDEADRLFFIREGLVDVGLMTPRRGFRTVQTVGEGDVLGWSWLVAPHQWHFEAQAHESTRALAFDGKCLRAKCEEDHELGYELLKRFAHNSHNGRFTSIETPIVNDVAT